MKNKIYSIIYLFLVLFTGCDTHPINQSNPGLPSIQITISDDALDSIVNNKHYKATAFILLVDSEGDTLLYDSLDNIHTRGNNTFGPNKKAFSVKLRKKAKVLGLDKGKRYALLANFYDESHIRNAVAFDLAREMGLEAPRYSFVSLYINANYLGLYQITNKVEDLLDFGRNGFLIEGNSCVELPRHLTDNEKDSIIRSYDLIKTYIENCFECDAYYDSLQQWVDLESFAKYFLIQEITLNMDAAGPGSFYKYASNEDGWKLHAGPIWDFDKSLATSHRGFYHEWEKNEVIAPLGITDSLGRAYQGLLLHSLYKREEFRDLVKTIYNNEISAICHNYLDSGKISELIEYLKHEAKNDYLVNLSGKPFVYEDETKKVQLFLKQRIDFLDWFFNTPDNNKVCIIYYDSSFRPDGDRIAQIMLPADTKICVPKLLEITFNSTPIPVALLYKGTDSIVSNQTLITSEDTLELKWRKPSQKEIQLRRIKKKLRCWGIKAK